MTVEVAGAVEITLKLSVPIAEAGRIAALVREIGELAADQGAAIEAPKQIAAPARRTPAKRQPKAKSSRPVRTAGPAMSPDRDGNTGPCVICGRHANSTAHKAHSAAPAPVAGVSSRPEPAGCQHHWIIADIDPDDESDTVKGRCKKCGAERGDFQPVVIGGHMAPLNRAASERIAATNIVALPRQKGASPTCHVCGFHPRSFEHQRRCKGASV